MIDIRDARGRLGLMWGLGRPLRMSELGRVLRLQGRDIGASVRDWERGHTAISGPVALAIELMLDGARPKHLQDALSGDGKSAAPE